MNKLNLFLFFLMALLFATSVHPVVGQTPYNLSIYAGTGLNSSIDPISNNVPATLVNLNNAVFHIAVAPNNEVYLSLWFTSTANRRLIKRIDANGMIFTVAGTGVSGSTGDGGSALSATIDPGDLIIDASNNIYFVNGGSSIRKVNGSTGIISTLYTTPSGQIASLAFAPDGNIYFGYETASRIRKLNLTTLAVTNVAGNGVSGYVDGPASTANFINARDMVVDTDGNIYFSEGGFRIRKLTVSTSTVSTIAGAGVSSNLVNGALASNITTNVTQNGLAIYNNEVHFTTGNKGIWKIKTDGTLEKVTNDGPSGGGMGQDIEINSAGDVFSAFGSGDFKGYVLKSCSGISSHPIASQTVCMNATPTQLSVGSTLSSTYQWYSNNSNSNSNGIQISQANSSTYTPPTNTAGTKYYYCAVTNSCGTAFSTVSQVVVNGLPNAFAGASNSICVSSNPSAITLSDATISGGATGTWSILSGGGILSTTSPVSNPATVTYTPAPNFVGTITLQLVSSLSGCNSQASTRTIVVKDIPTVPTLSASSNNVNPGTNITLSIQSGSLNGATQWQWYNGSCNGSTAGTGTSISITPCSSQTYYARATGGCALSNGACGSLAVNVVNSNTYFPQINDITVHGEPATKTQVVNSPTAFSYTNCGTQSTTITLSNANLNQASNWVWYTGGCGTSNGGTLVGMGSSITVSPSSTTTYYVRGEGSSSCLNNLSCNPVTITVNPAPACQNGGVAQNCGCNCPNGYSGDFCEQIATAASTLDFDGVNDVITVTSAANDFNFTESSPFTLEAWVKPLAPVNPNNTNNFILSKLDANARGYAMFTEGSELQVVISSNFSANELILVKTNGANLLDGSWHHVAASYLGSPNAYNISIFIDGIPQTVQVIQNNLNGVVSITNSEPLSIGGSPFGTFRGRMDEVRIWNTALSYTDLISRKNCEVPHAPNLLASYHFNQGLAGSNNNTPTVINTLTDSGELGNHGNLINFALSGSTSNWQSVGALTPGVSCCIQPQVPNLIVNDYSTCPNQPFTISVAPGSKLYSATQWEWFKDSCNGTSIGVGPSITVSVSSTESFYCRGTGGCVTTSICNGSTFTASDVFPPTFDPVNNVTVNTNSAGCMYNGTLTPPTAYDDCTSNVTVSGPVPAGPYPVGNTILTWTATDAQNNSTTIQQTLIVQASSVTASSTEVACDSYTWVEHANTVYTQSGNYTAVFSTSSGCDSIHTLHLTINPSVLTTYTETACGSYTWPVNNITYTQSGSYVYTGTTAFGCVHTKILNLTVNPIPVVTAGSLTICPGSTVNLVGSPTGGTFSISNPYTGPSTTYTYTYTSAEGCTATSAPATITLYDVSAPTGIAVIQTGINAVVNWTPSSVLNNFVIRYRIVGAANWTTQNAMGSSATLPLLTSCGNYELQMQTLCLSGDSGPWSSVYNFASNAQAPSNLNALVSGNKCTVSWSPMPGTTIYGLRYRRTNPIGAWITSTVNAPTKLITGLPRNACYEFQVQSFCTNSSQGSDWSASKNFCTASVAPSKPGFTAENEQEDYLVVYPNPANTMLQIDVQAYPSQTTRIKLMDLSGRVMQELSAFSLEEGIQHIEIPVSDYAAGMYVVQIYDDQNVLHTSKIMIQH